MAGVGNPNLKGNKNSGRKTDAEIIRHYINASLANEIANEELKKIKDKDNRNLEEIKTIVMPIVQKDMTEKKNVNVNLPKPIDDLLSDNFIQKDKRDEEETEDNSGWNISE